MSWPNAPDIFLATVNVSYHKEDFTKSTPVFEKDLTGLLVVDAYNDFISEGSILWPLIKETVFSNQAIETMEFYVMPISNQAS